MNATSRRRRILIVNASLAGDAGNTAAALDKVQAVLSRSRKVEVRVAVLAAAEGGAAGAKSFAAMKAGLAWADAFVFGTGTHWDSWSSALQKFLEEATEAEGTKLWLGKPAACIVTEHSVGGKSVLSRLQGVLVTLGCGIPPMSGAVLSKVAQIAREHAWREAEDFWCAEDLTVVAHNLIEAVTGSQRWKTWPVDRKDFSAKWLREGPLF